MFYFFLFFVSTVLFIHAERAYPTSHRLFYVLSYVAIFWLAFWAGYRDISVGTDTTFYGVDLFSVASVSENPIHEAFFDPYKEIEPFFFLLNNFASKIGGIHMALFFVMLVQLMFAFHGLKYFMSYVPLWIMMLAYVVIFYILTLNLMRQGIAVAIGLYAIRFVEQRKLLPLVLTGIFAFFWHNTSVVFFSFLLILYAYRWNDETTQRIVLAFAIPLSFWAIFSFQDALVFFLGYSEDLMHYASYAGVDTEHESFLNTIDIVSRIILLIVVGFLHKKETAPISCFYVLYLVLFVDLASRFLGVFTAYATRIAYYFVAIEIPYLFWIINSEKLNIQQRNLFVLSLLLLFSFMTIRENFYFGLNETYPYVFSLLDLTLY